ncbi:hypothetical protein [Paenibacillus sp. FSL L8-0708]|uniref:hypothetical protein n=1 Tax=Paenibacillus sp. FSL L8-0708 TaxID=2975311 RepID=UPI000FC05B79
MGIRFTIEVVKGTKSPLECYAQMLKDHAKEVRGINLNVEIVDAEKYKSYEHQNTHK